MITGKSLNEISRTAGSSASGGSFGLARLTRSLGEMRITVPLANEELVLLQQELVEKNGINEGRVYLQVTRGVAEREFAFPKGVTPTLIMFVREVAFLDSVAAREGVRVKLVEEQRWARRDIKSVMLAASALAVQLAKDEGHDDGWFVEEGFITEATSANAYIVKGGKVYTSNLSNAILGGCTRQVLMQLADQEGVEIVEQSFTPQEAKGADEAFVTSATKLVTPVISIDGEPVGAGKVGPVAKRLRELYIEYLTAGQ